MIRKIYNSCLLIILAFSLLALAGWAFGYPLLASIRSKYIPMAPLSAISFLLLVALLTIPRNFRWRVPTQILLTTAICLALIRVLLNQVGLKWGDIEQNLAELFTAFESVPKVSMSPISFVLFCASLGALLLELRRRRNAMGALAGLITLTAIILLIGYLYGTPLLYGREVIPIAFPTSICFLCFGFILVLRAGPAVFPLRFFVGTSTEVRLLRIILPATAATMILSGAVQAYLRRHFEINEALLLGVITIVSIAIIAATSLLVAQMIGRRMEQAEAETRRLAAIIEATSDLVGIFEVNGKPFYLNSTMRHVAGILETADYSSYSVADFFSEPMSKKLLEEIVPVARESGLWRGEFIFSASNGQEIPVSQVVLFQSDNIPGKSWFALVARDISDMKKAQAELEQFAYVASHDLKEPLRMVNSFMSLLQKNYSDQLDETANTYIRFAADGASRMHILINDLLNYSQAASDDLSREQIDPAVLIQELKSTLFADPFRDAMASIQVETLPVIYANKTGIRQVLQNLIGNALKYRKPDVPLQIHITGSDTSQYWHLAVTDNGIGINEEYHRKIFKIFQRLHSKAEFAGSGIGLALCKKIVEEHHGRIWVESVPGRGSTFHVTIRKPIASKPTKKNENNADFTFIAD